MTSPTLERLKKYTELRKKLEAFEVVKHYGAEELLELYDEKELSSWEEELRRLSGEVRSAPLLPEHRQELLEECYTMLRKLDQLKLIRNSNIKQFTNLREIHKELLMRIDELLGLLESKGYSIVLSREDVEELLHLCEVIDGLLKAIEDLCIRTQNICDLISLRLSRRTFDDLRGRLEGSSTTGKPLSVAEVVGLLHQVRANIQHILRT
ncbi:MAG: hypothetical protein QXZ31_07350 [Thermofilaceae archaeon]